MTLGCPTCGAFVTGTQRFCADCGTALGSAAGSAALPATEAGAVAERRVCSVLFCDLVGFTPLSESRDPEEVRELLSRYFATARTVIERYGGVVEKFIGDAVMAVWGTPVALEGDTERAVRAALDLVAAVQALGAEIGAPSLTARGGVVTGEVAVTLGATHEGMVAGDAVNTAARVQAVASAGSVLVDATTRRLAHAAVEFAEAGTFELKGKAEPQQLWRAERVLSGVGGAQRVDGLEAPLIGRDLELRMIKDLFHAALDRRQPRLVTMFGAAGSGKSRLGWEFEKYVDGLVASVWWHRGRCLSYGDGVSFWALAEIVRQRLGIAEEDPVDVATARLHEGVEKYLDDADERAYIGARLGRLLGLRYEGDTGKEMPREELFAGWRLWFERLAASQPVVLLIEDLHYADEGLLDFVDHLLDWTRDVPVFVLTSSRPEMRVQRAGWGTGRNRTALALEPLDGDAVARLLEALVPGIPAEAADAIAAQAQGIPLFVVETIRALIDQDVVVPRDGVYRLAGDVGKLAVPDSLHGLLAARLDALEPTARALVADAAVLGSSFPLDALTAVSGRPPEEVSTVVTDLVRRDVFEISADRLSPQRGNYRFSHDMLRQVAYDTLSRHDRKARHLAVANHLRTVFAADGEEVADVIAQHFLDAIAALPDDPDVEEVRQRAIAALTKAGERAARTGALAHAGASFAQAAELTAAAHTPVAELLSAQLWERAADTALDAARWEVVVGYADRAAEGYAAVGDRRSAARAQALAGRSFKSVGMFAEARERLAPALAVLSEEPDPDTIVAMLSMGYIETFAGSPDADRVTNEALATAQIIGAPASVMAEALTVRGIYLIFAGRPAESGAYQREAARLAEQIGDLRIQTRALINLSDVLGRVDPRAAFEPAVTAVELGRRRGDRDALGFAVINAAFAQVEVGEWDAAERTAATAAEQDGLDNDTTFAVLAWISALRGEAERAQSFVDRLSYLRASEAAQDQATIAMVFAFVAAAQHRPTEVLRHAREALEHIEALSPSTDSLRWAWGAGARAAHELQDVATEREFVAMLAPYRPGQLGGILHAELQLCEARLAVGSDAHVDAGFTEAIGELRERSTPYHLAHGLLDYAEHLAGRRDLATPLLEEAREIGVKIGAASVLERVTAMAATPVPAS